MVPMLFDQEVDFVQANAVFAGAGTIDRERKTNDLGIEPFGLVHFSLVEWVDQNDAVKVTVTNMPKEHRGHRRTVEDFASALNRVGQSRNRNTSIG